MGTMIEDGLTRPSIIKSRNGRPYIDLSTGLNWVSKIKHSTPPAGHVALYRVAGQNLIKIVYPDGQSESVFHNKNIAHQLTQRGLPPEKVERVLDYLWNYPEVFVDCEGRNPKPPPIPR